jgi:hypothetical protein
MNDMERAEIKALPLPELLSSKHGIKFDKYGKGFCPFHKGGNESKATLNIRKENAGWRWHCFACGLDGDYIDFVEKLENTNFKETVKKIQLENGLAEKSWIKTKKERGKQVATYVYADECGNPLYMKRKFDNGEYSQERYDVGKWKRGLENTRRVLYNLQELLGADRVFYLEGEKDCETLKALGYVATTAGSIHDWKREFASHFKAKDVVVCLDVGNEETEKKIAHDISGYAEHARILKLPGLTQREQDITDWIDMLGDISDENKRSNLNKIVESTPYYEPEQKEQKKPSQDSIKRNRIIVESAQEFMGKEIPPREILMEYWLEKEALAVLGGKKKKGKSLLSLNLALKLAQGRDFLGFKIPKQRKVLLFQQEISQGAMRERIDKMLKHEDTPSNLRLVTLTEGPIKITNSQDRKEIHEAIDTAEPDLVIFDPLATFHNKVENDASEMSEVLGHFCEIIGKFRVGILLIHHFGKPSLVPKEGADKLRGSTVIGDRPDAIITLHELDKKYKNTKLPLPFKNYSEVLFELRNDEEPDGIYIERDKETLWHRISNVFRDHLGRKMLPKDVKQIVKSHGGKIQQKELTEILMETVSKKVALRLISETEEKGDIERVPLGGPGNPLLVKLKDREYSLDKKWGIN